MPFTQTQYTHNISILTRITDRKIPCVYIDVYKIIKNWGPGPYNSLRHADNRKYFSGLSLTRNRREAHMFNFAREVGKFGCFCWEKGNFIMINEFKHGQTWKVWPSPLSSSLYSTFKLTFCGFYGSYWDHLGLGIGDSFNPFST